MKTIAIWIFSVAIAGFSVCSRADDVLYYTSSPASWIGQGWTRTLTPANGLTFTAYPYLNQGTYTNDVHIALRSLTVACDLDFIGPNHSLVTLGDYPDAQRFPFEVAGNPGLAFAGDGRGTNSLTGDFQVLEATFDSGGNVLSFAADFIQYEDGIADEWDQGSIRFNSDIPITTVPEPCTFILAACGALGVILARRKWCQR